MQSNSVSTVVINLLKMYSRYRTDSDEPELALALSNVRSQLNHFHPLALKAGIDLAEYVEGAVFKLLLNEDLLLSGAPSGTQRLELFGALLHVHTLFLENQKREADRCMKSFCQHYVSSPGEQEGQLA